MTSSTAPGMAAMLVLPCEQVTDLERSRGKDRQRSQVVKCQHSTASYMQSQLVRHL